MAEGTITARGQSKNGKATITIDGQLHYAGNTDLGGLMVGDRIAYNATSFANGKLWGIDKGWKLLAAAQKYAHSAPPVIQPQRPNAAPTQSTEAPSGVSEPERIFAYGVVTEAIKASLVKDRVEMALWACAAVHAIRFAGTNWPEGDLGKRLGEFLDKSHQ